jgi:SAM-dependent MidA family methyltransferase
LNQVAEKILAEIRNRGAISFARFMECALYCPVYGYYEKEEDTLGRRGDYCTSVSVGPLFGELLALQFSNWLEELLGPLPETAGRECSPLRAGWAAGIGGQRTARPTSAKSHSVGKMRPKVLRQPPQVVEAGAHNGDLARDILTWIRAQRPTLFSVIQYIIVERSGRRQEFQRRTLAEFTGQVRWVSDLAELSGGAGAAQQPTSRRAVRGVIFSNELLDAMPLHRLVWDAKHSIWFELGVMFSDGRFNWTRLQNSALPIEPPAWPKAILKGLPDGFTVEVCPAASQWWLDSAEILAAGSLVTIDYGLIEDEMLSTERKGGTLRGYRRHHLASDVLADPGEQDITAHVNFSALCRVGERAGLKTDALWTQEQFLTRIAAPIFKDGTHFGQWTSGRTRQFQTLTHPNHLGGAFRVLVQSRSGKQTADIR